MLNIKDRFYLSIKIDGKLLSLQSISLKSITMQSNVIFSFPTACLELGDNIRYFDENPILDGSTIEIVSGTDYSKLNKPLYRFRVYSVTHKEAGSVVYYTINCTLNAPKYINENFKGSYSSTSAAAITSIATVCGLTPDVDTTTDNQVWYGAGKRRCLFAKEISKNSYLNNSSCFGLGLTLDSKLKLKNISAVNLANSTNLFVQGNKVNKDVISVLDKKESTNSGLFNNLAAYKFEGVEQSSEGTTSYTEIQLSTKSTSVNVNSLLNSKLTGSTLKIYPVSSGNTYSNYYLSEYQNLRVTATYGNVLYIMSNQESMLDLFDPLKYVLFDNINGEVKINSKLSGGYLITGKTIYIEAGAYYEKLQITRQGYNLDILMIDKY